MPLIRSQSLLIRVWAYCQRVTGDASVSVESSIPFRPCVSEIVKQVVVVFKVSPESILEAARGGRNNIPRWVVMHFCQELGGLGLRSIAQTLGLKRTGSIPTTIKKLTEMMKSDDALVRKVEKIRRRLG